MHHALLLCACVLGTELGSPSLKGKCFIDRAISPVPTDAFSLNLSFPDDSSAVVYFIYFMHMCVLSEYVCVYHVQACCLSPDGCIRYFGTGVIDVFEPTGRCWQLNSGPSQEQ